MMMECAFIIFSQYEKMAVIDIFLTKYFTNRIQLILIHLRTSIADI